MRSRKSIVASRQLRRLARSQEPVAPGKSTRGENKKMNFKRRSPVTTSEATRRTHERVEVHVPVVVISSTYGTTVISSGRTSDLSEAGMAVITAASLAPGQNVSIEFTIPASNQKMKMQAIVKHKEQNLYGFEFGELSPAQRTQIHRFATA
jgi:c-di-GMP-binding flagellar brake protein YcgR